MERKTPVCNSTKTIIFLSVETSPPGLSRRELIEIGPESSVHLSYSKYRRIAKYNPEMSRVLYPCMLNNDGTLDYLNNRDHISWQDLKEYCDINITMDRQGLQIIRNKTKASRGLSDLKDTARHLTGEVMDKMKKVVSWRDERN